jgi:hypothetical protein
MKLQTLFYSIGLVALAGSHPALAQEARTRAQVRAELDQAMRSGDMLAPGDTGVRLNQLRPDLYPRVAQGPVKSRGLVKAELAEAIRTGDLLAGGNTGLKLNELTPNLYPPVAQAQGKSREQAKAELAEALRTGDILAGGESSQTLAQIYPWSYRPDGRTVVARRLPRWMSSGTN